MITYCRQTYRGVLDILISAGNILCIEISKYLYDPAKSFGVGGWPPVLASCACRGSPTIDEDYLQTMHTL